MAGGPDDGAVSHRSAAILHELGDIPAPQIELTVSRRRTTREPGVRLHIGELAASDITFVDGLPVTTAERTIIDLLESRADGAHVGRIIADADRRGLIDLPSLERNVAGYSRRYGLPGNAGADLLANLAEQAGERLSTTDAQQAMRAGVLAGSSVSDIIHAGAISSGSAPLPSGDEKLLAAIAQSVASSNENLAAAIAASTHHHGEKLLTPIVQTVMSSNERLIAALASASKSNIEAISAQAVAAILSNPALTQQILALRNTLAVAPHRDVLAAGVMHDRGDED